MADRETSATAIHVPSGEVRDAANITDSVEKAGPWRCPAQGCSVPLHHRIGYLRRAARSGESLPIAATFCSTPSAPHDYSVPHTHVVRRSTRTVGGDDSRLHIRRLTGQPTTPVQTPPTSTDPTGLTRTAYEYGESINQTVGLVIFSRSLTEEPNLRHTEWLQYDSTRYTWDELAYDADEGRYRVLERRVKERFHTNIPYFIQGVVKEASRTIFDGSRRQIRLASSTTPGAPDVHVFMPNTEDFRRLTVGLPTGTPVAVFSRRSGTLDRVEGVYVELEFAHQLVILTDVPL